MKEPNVKNLVDLHVRVATHVRLPLVIARSRFEADFLCNCYIKANCDMEAASKIAGLSGRGAMRRAMLKRGVWPWKGTKDEKFNSEEEDE